MISFGNYLLSEQRRQHKITARRATKSKLPLTDDLMLVTQCDRLHWEELPV